MGYFRQPIRSGQCREAIRRALRATSMLGAGSVYAPRIEREVFLRFSAGSLHPDSHQQRGIFHVDRDPLSLPNLTTSQWAILDESRRWFNEKLVSPRFDEGRAIFWFRAESAGECVTRIWARVRLLREHGIVVHMLRCTDPGRIVYRDEHQVAAIPQRRPGWRTRTL